MLLMRTSLFSGMVFVRRMPPGMFGASAVGKVTSCTLPSAASYFQPLEKFSAASLSNCSLRWGRNSA